MCVCVCMYVCARDFITMILNIYLKMWLNTQNNCYEYKSLKLKTSKFLDK